MSSRIEETRSRLCLVVRCAELGVSSRCDPGWKNVTLSSLQMIQPCLAPLHQMSF